jgi:hypothetical protein
VEDSSENFFLDGVDHSIMPLPSLQSCLAQLRSGFVKISNRFQLGEVQFFKSISSYLHHLVEMRIQHIAKWLAINTERFGNQGEITLLFRTFDTHAKELRASVILCGSKCSSCGLLCLEHKQHTGKHHCQTSHRCSHLCGFIDQHEGSEIPECDIPLVSSSYFPF